MRFLQNKIQVVHSMVKITEKPSLQMLIYTNSQNQRQKYHFSIDKLFIAIYNISTVKEMYCSNLGGESDE